MAHPNW